MKKLSYWEAVGLIKKLETAKDRLGNRLYDDDAIAEYFGYESSEKFKNAMKEAQDAYRRKHIETAAALEKDGMSYGEIAEKLGLTIETVEVLLDKDANERLNKNKEIEEARKKMLEKTVKDMNEAIEQSKNISRIFGWP